MNRNLSLAIIQRKNTSTVKLAYFVLCLFVVFLFTDNHSALFISDYYLPLLVFSFLAFLVAFCSGRFVLNYFSIVCILAFLLLSLLSLLRFNEIDKGTWLSYAVWFLVLTVLPSIRPDKSSLNLLLNSFIIGSLICAAMIFVFGARYGTTDRFTIHFLDNEVVDPNYLGCFLYLGFSFSLFYLVKRREKMNKIKFAFYIVASISIVVSIFLTGSRAAYLCSFITFVGFLLESFKHMQIQKKLALVVGLSLLVLVGFILLFLLLPQNILNRFGLGGLNDESNSLRVQHWIYGLEAFLKHPIGYGTIHTKDILSNYVGHVSDCHNTYITFLLHFGIFGFFLLFYLFARTFYPFFKYRSPFWICLILAFAFNGFIIANHFGVPFWMPLVILYYVNDKSFLDYYVKFN